MSDKNNSNPPIPDGWQSHVQHQEMNKVSSEAAQNYTQADSGDMAHTEASVAPVVLMHDAIQDVASDSADDSALNSASELSHDATQVVTSEPTQTLSSADLCGEATEQIPEAPHYPERSDAAPDQTEVRDWLAHNDAQEAAPGETAGQIPGQMPEATLGQTPGVAQGDNSQVPYAQVAPAPVIQRKQKKASKGPLSSFVTALLGGICGALILYVLLQQVGLIQASTITARNSAGQTVSITANGEDTSIAKAVAAKCLPSVVSINVVGSDFAGVGSGVILDDAGHILTNYHVIEGATNISITIDKKSFEASVIGSDPSSDLAVVKVQLDGMQVIPMTIGDSDKLTPGDWVMAIGSPYGLDQSVSTGIVSSVYRSTMLAGASGNTIYANLIQTDAAINPGNSGGALVNEHGELVGINSIIESESGANAGIGFAIPSNYAIEIANTIIDGKQVLHAYIGLSLATVDAQNAAYNNLWVNQGAYVMEVADSSPAAAAGLKQGDIITAVNGEEISSADALILAIRSHKVGDRITVTFVRGKQTKTVDVTLGSDEKLQAEQNRRLNENKRYGSLGDLLGLNENSGDDNNSNG